MCCVVHRAGTWSRTILPAHPNHILSREKTLPDVSPYFIIPRILFNIFIRMCCKFAVGKINRDISKVSDMSYKVGVNCIIMLLASLCIESTGYWIVNIYLLVQARQYFMVGSMSPPRNAT